MTAPYICRCPACKTPLKLKDDSLIGKRIKCPKCAGVVVVPGPDGAAPTAPRAPAAPAAKTAPQPTAPPARPAAAPPAVAAPAAPAKPSTPTAVPMARKVPVPAPPQPSSTEETMKAEPPESIRAQDEDQGSSPPFTGGGDEATDDEYSARPKKRKKEKARSGFGVIPIIALVLVVVYLGLATAVNLNLIGEQKPQMIVMSPKFNNYNIEVPNRNDKPVQINPGDQNPPDKNPPDKNPPDKNPQIETPPDKTNTGKGIPYPQPKDSDGQIAMRQRAASLAKEEAAFKTLLGNHIDSGDIEILTLYINGEVTAFALSPDSKWLAAGDAGGHITLMDLTKGEYNDTLTKHTGKITGLAFDSSGSRLGSCSEDHTVQIWNLSQPPGQRTSQEIKLPAETVPHCLAFSPDGKQLAVGSTDPQGNAVVLWNGLSMKPEAASLSTMAGSVQSLAYRSDGKVLAVLHSKEGVVFFEPSSRKRYDRTDSTKGVTRVEFCADGSFLAASSKDEEGKTRLVHQDLRKGKELTVAASFGNRFEDKNLANATIILPTLLGSKSASFPSRFAEIKLDTLCFSPGGQFLAAAGGGIVKLWYVPDLQNDALLRTMEMIGNNGSVRRVGNGIALELGGEIGDAELEKLPPGPFVTQLFAGGSDKITNAGLSNLRKYPRLQVLQLVDLPKIDDAGLEVLTALTRLEVLLLGGNKKVTDAAVVRIGQLQELKELALDSTMVTGAAMDKLRTLKNLSSLNLHGCAIGDLGDLKMLTKLTTLNLSSCSMTDAGVSKLANLPSLETLYMADNPKITDASLKSLKGLTNLKFLDLSQTNLGDQGLANLKDLKALQFLYINGTKVTDAGFEHLADLKELFELGFSNLDGFNGTGLKHLAHLENLRNLNLSATKVTDQGMQSIKELKQIQSIQLPPGVSDVGLEPLANLPNLNDVYPGKAPNLKGPGLKHLQKVRALDLSQTGVTDEGLANVKDIKTLTYLALPTRITDAGLKHLEKLEELNSLSLRETQVTDVGLKRLTGLKKLAFLDLNGTKVTAKGIEELKTALPQLNVQKDE